MTVNEDNVKPLDLRGRKKARGARKLMDLQDNVNRGDGVPTPKKVKYTLYCPEDLLEEARQLADERGYSVTRLFVDGLRMRLGKEV